MNDIHNHLLYGIDDGARNIDESINLLKYYESVGVRSIMLTPHFINESRYCSNNEEKRKLIDSIKDKTSIKLYMGNEVYISDKIISFINSGDISTLNGSRYILIEFPLRSRLNNYQDITFDLINNGYIPIIAHPERYHYLELEELIKLHEMGCLFQGNISSLNDKYGKDAKNNLILLLKKKMIYVMGSDSHRYGENINSGLEKLKEIVDDSYYNELINDNFDKIINNEVINKHEIKKVNRLFKERIK